MGTYAISVIIPVYNREKSIENCITSVLEQSFWDFELILIDDWSTDGSLNVLKNLMEKDKRIKVFSQENSWPWLARNLWIKNAKWEYIMFIDSDDLVEKEYLFRYYNAIKRKNLDIVIWWYKMFRRWELIKENKIRNNLFSKYIYTFPWGKIISHKFLIENEIIFPDMKIKEDLYFCRLMYNKTKKIWMLNYNWYIYNVWESDSIVSNLSKKFYSELIPYLNQLHDIVPLTKFDKKIMDYELIKWYIINLFYAGKYANYKTLISEYKIMKKWFNNVFYNWKICLLKWLFKPFWDPILYLWITISFMIIDSLWLFPLFARIYCKIFYNSSYLK